MLKVSAGSFDAVKVIIEPVSTVEGKDAEEFEGLFGLHGSIALWIDKESRIPIKIEGTLPFGLVDLFATIELTEIRSRADDPSSKEPGL